MKKPLEMPVVASRAAFRAVVRAVRGSWTFRGSLWRSGPAGGHSNHKL